MTSPTLEITPHPAWGAVSNAEPTTVPTGRDGMVGASPTTLAAFRRATSDDYFGWLDHIRSAAACTRPIRLVGFIDTVHAATGQRLHRTDTASMPDGAIYKACGTRRATVCPACARTYQYDAYQLLRAGLSGGKGIPEGVTTHPAAFLTLTAPSFGLVHSRVVNRHTCRDKRRCQCRPDPCHARTGPTAPGLCEHRRPAVCFARHDSDDPRLGQPFCLDCYDHDGQVVFNTFAGQLWARTKQNIQRELAHLAKQRGIPAAIVYGTNGKPRKVAPIRATHGKVAEMQRRGVVHFHAILRLDGVHPTDPDTVTPPPAGITVDDLHAAIRAAAARTVVGTPAHSDQPQGWTVRWGEQVDIATIELTGEDEVTDAKVAGYLAKYATKSTEITGHNSGRLTHHTIGDYADPDGDHTARLIDACWRLGRPTTTPRPLAQRPAPPRPASTLGPQWTCPDCGTPTRLRHCGNCPEAQTEVDTKPASSGEPSPYDGLRRWAHLLGFGGHFLTKGRHYSTTFTALRAARVAYRREVENDDQGHEHDADPARTGPIRPATDQDHENTVLLVGSLTYAGTGWHTSGDALLAATAADLARSRRQAGREELAHELGTTQHHRSIRQAA